jgi:hypothetical protein
MVEPADTPRWFVPVPSRLLDFAVGRPAYNAARLQGFGGGSMRYHLTLIFGLLVAVMASTQAFAERRVALVVGNSHYVNTVVLRNPDNDAQDVAAKLKQLGFQVMLGLDLDQREFAQKVEEFGRVLDGADVGLFFYAGHGVQVNEHNYLVSTGAKLESEFLVSAEAIEVDGIVRMMEARAATNIVFLDACRNNPLAENLRRSALGSRSLAVGSGLAKITPSNRDTLVAFSAAPGQTASDGAGRNSPFTTALLKHIADPNTEVSVMLKEVAGEVRDATQNSQRPQAVSDMARTFFFAKADVAAPAPPPAAGNDKSVEVAFFQSAIAANDCGSIQSYLTRFPNGTFADLAKLSEQRLCAAPPTPVVPAKPVAIAPPPPPPVVAALSPPTAPVPAGPSPTDIAKNLQAELIRVGCGAELKMSGDWDSASKSALRLFNRYAKTNLSAPSQDSVASVHSHDGRVCPLVCGSGMQAQGDTCVAMPAKPVEPSQPPPPKEAARPRPNSHDDDSPPPPKQASRPRPSSHDDDSPPPARSKRGARPSQAGGGGTPFAPEGGQQRGTRANNAISQSPITSGGMKCQTLDIQGQAPRIVCP